MRVLKLFLLSSFLFTTLNTVASTQIDLSLVNRSSQKLEHQREAYIQARDAIKRGDHSVAIKAKEGILKDYPLNVWLDYYMLSVSPSKKKFNDVLAFISQKRQTQLGQLLKDKYIEYLSNIGDYKSVSVLLPTKPYQETEVSTAYQKGQLCRFHESKWHLGKAKEDAIAYAQSLYLSLKRVPNSCRGLISILETKGYLTDKLILEKFERAFILRDYEQTTKKMADALQESQFKNRVDLSMNLYKNPEKIFSKDFTSNSEDQRRIATLAFKRYANISTTDARSKLNTFIKKFKPTETEIISIKQIIAQNCLNRNRPFSDVQWVDQNLPAVAWTEFLKEQRLRRAIWYSQWDIVYKLLEHMPSNFQNEVNWKYWKAYSAERLGYKDQAKLLFNEVAKDRSFFGFLAAQQLHQKYPYNHQKLTSNASWEKLVKTNEAVKRFFELDAINDNNKIFEFREIVIRSTPDDAMLMAQWALQTGNIRLAIESVVVSKRWDALSYRFPLAFYDIYKKNSKEQGVSLSFLYGISRQESMLNPTIKSPVGATGLMQLMPATASLVARKNSYEYKGRYQLVDPELNVKLGTAYLRSLLNKFNNNRVLAAVGYNAGPGRVNTWRSKDGKFRNVAQYVENIPFLETRKYVQNVILYDAIYNYLITGKEGHLLTKEELNHKY